MSGPSTAGEDPCGLIAHSRSRRQGRWHSLADHLHATADLARGFADPWGGGDFAHFQGLTHDVGKASDPWQDRIRMVVDGERVGIPHHRQGAGLGALYLGSLGDDPAVLHAQGVGGHHGGLPDFGNGLLEPLRLHENGAHAVEIDGAEVALGLRFSEVAGKVSLPAWLPRRTAPAYGEAAEKLTPSERQDALVVEFFGRMSFSALVDADWTDTAAHFADASHRVRPPTDMARLLDTFMSVYERKHGHAAATPMNVLRRDLFEEARAAAHESPGFFPMPAPTGAGKTLATMAFGLEHAVRHGHRRVIVAVPYTTITTQNAAVYREFLDPRDDGGVVLEHHSAINDLAVAADPWRRSAVSNWDAPVVVTTDVQLFESLLDNRPSKVRKLHRIAGSVIVLDEVQSLPLGLAPVILGVLRELVDHYGVTVLFSSATPPDFTGLPAWQGVQQRTVGTAADHPTARGRVSINMPGRGPAAETTWPSVAHTLSQHRQALAVVNTIKSSQTLWRVLATQGAVDPLAFSTRLCGAHREAVITEAKRRLDSGHPVHLVSTQAIQAGVDISFPYGIREEAPAPDIDQSAGRVNRHGESAQATLDVVRVKGAGTPGGEYRTGTQITRRLFVNGKHGLATRDGMNLYFREMVLQLMPGGHSEASRSIETARAGLRYQSVSDQFRMIEDGHTTPVLIDSYGTIEQRRKVRELVGAIESGATLEPSQRMLLRRFTAAAPAKSLATSSRELADGTVLWLGEYHPVLGIVVDSGAGADIF